MMKMYTEKTITYTFVYGDQAVVRYFVEIQGKYYEMIFNNGDIKIKTDETNLGEISKEPEVTVESSDSSIIEARKEEDGKILLTAKDIVGDVEITVNEKNSNTTKTFKATTKIPATDLSLSKETITIEQGSTLAITATVVPSNTTDKVIWEISSSSIATVTEDTTKTTPTANVTGKSIGNANITVTCGEYSKTCRVTVTKPTANVGTISTATHTAKDLTYTWDEMAILAEAIAKNANIKWDTTEEVNLTLTGKSYKIGIGDRLKVNGKVVRILGFNHDEMSDAQKKTAYDGKRTYAGISFEYVDFITDDLQMNSASTNEGGWGASKLRGTLNGTIYNSLPNSETLNSPKSHIKEVKKAYSPSYNSSTIPYCNDKLWILSCAEIWNNAYSGFGAGYSKAKEGKQYKYYKKINATYNSNNTALKKPSIATGTNGSNNGHGWWLCSLYGDWVGKFVWISESGNSLDSGAGGTRGVAPGFSI